MLPNLDGDLLTLTDFNQISAYEQGDDFKNRFKKYFEQSEKIIASRELITYMFGALNRREQL